MIILQSSTMSTFRQHRVIGDVVFSSGVVTPAYFIIGLKTGWSLKQKSYSITEEYPETVNEDLDYKNA